METKKAKKSTHKNNKKGLKISSSFFLGTVAPSLYSCFDRERRYQISSGGAKYAWEKFVIFDLKSPFILETVLDRPMLAKTLHFRRSKVVVEVNISACLLIPFGLINRNPRKFSILFPLANCRRA